MSTLCIPMNLDGTIHDRLGSAPVVATCGIRDGQIVDWTEHPVEWDRTYGVDVPGVHHPRLIRFMRDQGVTDVVADDVCESVQRVMATMGIAAHLHVTGDARTAAGTLST